MSEDSWVALVMRLGSGLVPGRIQPAQYRPAPGVLMTYNSPPPPPPPYGPPPPDQGFYPPPPAKKSNATKVALIVVGGVVTLCLGMVVIGALLPDAAPKPAPLPVAPAAAPALPSLPAAPSLPPADLSSPEVAKPVKMPDVKGQNAAVAEDHLRKLGFTNIQFGSADQFDTLVVLPSNWTVTKQSTKAGRSIPADTLIVLTCTKGGS